MKRNSHAISIPSINLVLCPRPICECRFAENAIKQSRNFNPSQNMFICVWRYSFSHGGFWNYWIFIRRLLLCLTIKQSWKKQWRKEHCRMLHPLHDKTESMKIGSLERKTFAKYRIHWRCSIFDDNKQTWFWCWLKASNSN